MSLSVIAAAAAAVVGGTGAFFSDSETSTGNTFTAGAIDLKVDSQQHYNNAVCVPNTQAETQGDYWWQLEEGKSLQNPQYPVIGSACDGTWVETDLGLQHQFFDFDDVKPGDFGENTISLHVVNNDAWVCADVNITENSDNGINEPEDEVALPKGDNSDGTTSGDLASNLWFVAWDDRGVQVGQNLVGKGDNKHQAGEPLLFNEGPASNVLSGATLALAEAPGAPIVGGDDASSTRYIGLAWCAGTMTADTNSGDPTCDATSMGNIAQTDRMKADLTFRVEQARNNPNFRCASQEKIVTSPGV